MILGKLCGWLLSVSVSPPEELHGARVHWTLGSHGSVWPEFTGRSGHVDLCGYLVELSLFRLGTWSGSVLGFAVAGQGLVGASPTVDSCFQGLSMGQIKSR